jgi:hypothetical protein
MSPLRLNVAWRPKLPARACWREPTLEELLSEPIIKALMDADGVDAEEFEVILRRTISALRRKH